MWPIHISSNALLMYYIQNQQSEYGIAEFLKYWLHYLIEKVNGSIYYLLSGGERKTSTAPLFS